MHRTPVSGSGDTGWNPRVHGLDEELEVFDSRLRQHPVTQAEDVAGPAGCPPQHVIRPRPDKLRRAEQHRRVEVALDASLASDATPPVAEGVAPIQRDDIGPRL